MKIKSVCELTGLTDRTIRYYIEEKLILPLYTENYLGRKTYNFSEKDINDLKDISILRKFDFTIDEIKSIIIDSETSKEILLNIKNRTAKTILEGQIKHTVLSQINTEKIYTIAELAKELSSSSLDIPERNENIKNSFVKKIWFVLKAIATFTITWLPILLSLFVVMVSLNTYRYPVFEPIMIVLTIISLFPSFIFLILPKIKVNGRKTSRYISLFLCMLSIPVSFFMSFGIISTSETTNFVNYRDFDAECLANRDTVFQKLFPNWPHYFENVRQADGTFKTVYLDAHYYYRYLYYNQLFDVYAEWPLDKDSYKEEVERVSEVFAKYEFIEQQKGDYNCLILYNGDEPFSAVSDRYHYIIFAYNDKNNTVRYIYCYCDEYVSDQPYYLELDW